MNAVVEWNTHERRWEVLLPELAGMCVASFKAQDEGEARAFAYGWDSGYDMGFDAGLGDERL